jgi:hypothetical protein
VSVAVDLPISFRIGARTLARLHRRLVRVAVPLELALSGQIPELPPLPDDADGYSILSMPVAQLGRFGGALLASERQRYRRWYADLSLDAETWRAGLSSNLRSTLKRKGKRIAALSDGRLDIRRYRTVDEILAFHALAHPLAMQTYQERMLGMGLPGTPTFAAQMLRLAAADRVRAWLLFVGGEPAAYLYCPVQGDDVIYEYVGHAERFDALSPGTVLMAEALGDLMTEGAHARFDFTEGEGQHKRQFATGHVECCDLFLLRPTMSNRAAMASLRTFDGAVARAKQAMAMPLLANLGRRLRGR